MILVYGFVRAAILFLPHQAPRWLIKKNDVGHRSVSARCSLLCPIATNILFLFYFFDAKKIKHRVINLHLVPFAKSLTASIGLIRAGNEDDCN